MQEGIRTKVAAGLFEFSRHAVDQSVLRHIPVQAVRKAIARGEIIEDYPDDKCGPSCLLLAYTVGQASAHSVQLSVQTIDQDDYALRARSRLVDWLQDQEEVR